MIVAYYNEIEPYAAQWLRNLIAAGHIAPGDVDERDIRDVRPDDLRPYRQCHFFAGIGVWSRALRMAGWGDDRPVWTGSCPCQPFSAAGAGLGFADERHLWPAWHWLIQECRPAIVLGEQVASAAAGPWLDLVFTDMEALDYACGTEPFPSAGVGAPHIRDRLYWVAASGDRGGVVSRQDVSRVDNASRSILERLAGNGGAARRQGSPRSVAQAGVLGRLADLHDDGREPGREGCATVGHGTPAEPDRGAIGLAHASGVRHLDARRRGAVSGTSRAVSGEAWQQRLRDESCASVGGLGGLAHADGGHPCAERQQRGREQRQQPEDSGYVQDGSAGPTNGLWRAADWLLCRDGKWRPVEPGTFPLAHGAPARVGRLRAYGNAINAEAARVFVECVMESLAC